MSSSIAGVVGWEGLGRRDGGVRRVRMYEYAVLKSSDDRADETAREMTRRSAVMAASSKLDEGSFG